MELVLKSSEKTENKNEQYRYKEKRNEIKKQAYDGIYPRRLSSYRSYFVCKLFPDAFCIQNQETNTLYSFINRSTLDLDAEFKKYAELAKLITNDENVNDILSTIYLDDNRINEKFDLSVAPSLDTFIYFHNEVSKITIYTDRIVDYKNKYLAPIEELKKADWYESIADSRNNNWIAGTDEKTIVLVRKMQSLEENGINGYFYEKINYDNVFESLNENISDNYGIYVSDRLGQNIYSYDTFTDKIKNITLVCRKLQKNIPTRTKTISL